MLNSKSRKLAFVAVLAFSAAGTWAWLGLSDRVEVVYDVYRVPTIQASTEVDALYTLGYLHAKDRLFQMDVQRRLYSGELAELVGGAGLEQDVLLRTLGLRRAAEDSLAVQTPEIIEWLEAYSAGVNAYLQDGLYATLDDASCSSGGSSSDDSQDGASADSSDDRANNSDDSGGGPQFLQNPLPPEYAALGVARSAIPLWTPTDSLTVAKGLAFGLSFDLEDIDRTLALLTFRGTEGIYGFNGFQLFGADLYRSQPFDSAVSIPAPAPGAPTVAGEPETVEDHYLSHPHLESGIEAYRAEAAASPVLEQALNRDFTRQGSNWFIAAGSKTDSGYPMIANDPHLSLGTPSTFYEAHIQVENGINVTGSTFPGAPGVVLGCTDIICWGATVNALDVTDVYQEVLIGNPPQFTLFEGGLEPLQYVPQQYLFNILDGNGTLADAHVLGLLPPDTAATLIVPRRNNGPIVRVIPPGPGDPPGTPTLGLSVMYAGFSPTRELEAFRLFARARNPQDFKDALQFFDVGSQNWGYADVNGNIAYYTSGEIPIREDLQDLFFPDGLQPPYFIRDGTHTLRHEWKALSGPLQPGQALTNWDVLPFAEMPQLENPASGIILNANNDPIGTSLDNVPWDEFRAGFNGRLYLSYGYAPGFRMGRITRVIDDLLATNGTLTVQDFKDLQANNQLLDAEFFTPYILDAFDNAVAAGSGPLVALANDPGIAEAVTRLAAWDFSTPTGITEGFDPGDSQPLLPPTQTEIDHSIAATIYSVWRGQLVQRVIDGTLSQYPLPPPDNSLAAYAPGSAQSLVAIRRLLLTFPIRGGFGQGLVNFFNEPDGATADERRDLILLRALQNALGLLASNDFADAFNNSADQDDYRWGKLHRIVYAHPLGGLFNIPPTGGPGNLGPNLPGIARAGGLGAVDASSHSARSDGLNEFMFSSGPSRRKIAVMTPTGPDMLEVLPGGESGIPGSPQQTDQLDLWLVNDYKSMPLTPADVLATAQACQTVLPPPAGNPADANAVGGVGIPVGNGQVVDEQPAGGRGAGGRDLVRSPQRFKIRRR